MLQRYRIQAYIGRHGCSPHYHQSSGLAEKYLQLMKSLFSKAKVTGENPHFPWWHTGTPHMAMVCNPPWSCCMSQNLNLTYLSDMARIQVGQLANNRSQAEAVRPTNKTQAQTTVISSFVLKMSITYNSTSLIAFVVWCLLCLDGITGDGY